MTKRKKSYYAYLEGYISIIINLLLFALKYWAGIVSGSVALIADAWHTLSDTISSIVVIVGTKASELPADKEHPFGHGRSILIASLIIAVFLCVIAFNFIIESVARLQNHESAEFGILAIVILVVSILGKELLAQIAFWAGRKSNNISLKADGWHHRSDAISSVVVLAGVFLADYFWWIDGVMGILVAILLFYVAYEIFKETISPLLGEKPDEELEKKIVEISNQESGMDVKAHHIHIHEYGNHSELTFHVRLPDKMTILEAHKISSKIEKRIRLELEMSTTIHFDPVNNV
ncbi:MAG: cation transporter [Bacteroidales bacterium]|nr:cation transporter [Bacteroidales bacterium]